MEGHYPQLFTYLQDSGIVEIYKVWQCYAYSDGSPPLIIDIIIFIYLSLLQFVGIILAIQTRKVKINALNDSKSVTVLIYISSIVLVMIFIVSFLSRGHYNTSTALFSGGIIFLATVFLVITFVPKVCKNLTHKSTVHITLTTLLYVLQI